MSALLARWLGTVPYREAEVLQRAFHERRPAIVAPRLSNVARPRIGASAAKPEPTANRFPSG